ncbi:MAG: hypothetical protein CVV35_01480 [Methanomicrobiales archaeon HGW-Methanomicrobiales-6]|jgi:UDP-N-acetyl-D-mannosaminuronate dehydrogenase|nr:MAG: hypothetical protein CVV35_01480 [Methanomicrobiales archaeon HGW-Methanomicrobiales-6]
MSQTTKVGHEQDHWRLVNPKTNVWTYDPFVSSFATKARMHTSVASVEKALSSAESAVFLMGHDTFHGTNPEILKELMPSSVVGAEENLFAVEKGIIYLGLE